MSRTGLAARLSLAALVAAGAGCGGPDTTERILDHLRSDTHDELVVELDAAPGLAPRPDALEAWRQELQGLVDKPAGVRIDADGELPAREQWSLADLPALEDHFGRDDGVHLLWLGGEWADGDPDTLGLGWDHRHIIVFAEVLDRVCTEGLTGQGIVERGCTATEQAVLLHEFGHVVGLVNRGLPMVADHEDPDSPGHDAEESIMASGYDGPDLFQHVRGQVQADEDIAGFGPTSLADIAAIRDAAERPELD
jgi:hypothetical protein